MTEKETRKAYKTINDFNEIGGLLTDERYLKLVKMQEDLINRASNDLTLPLSEDLEEDARRGQIIRSEIRGMKIATYHLHSLKKRYEAVVENFKKLKEKKGENNARE